MERQEIAKKLTDVVAVYVADPTLLGRLSEESTLLGELNINSLHLIDIMLDVETAFDIEINGDEADALNRVGNALSLIERKLSEKQRAVA